MGQLVKVLIVDADLHSLSRIYLGLLDREFPVEASNDLEELLPRIRRFQPQVLLISEEMGRAGLNGLQRQLKSAGIFTILMTEPGNSPVAADLPVDERIEKPLHLHHLMERLSRLPVPGAIDRRDRRAVQ